ncbi:CAF17-like 4Fe-4S cluster assembly/insertion protein YgfZ [Nakamurella endophytica]|uniref:Glycine cleavage system protein T n=1 Tax=Nakamurella endophytica TaxID=1748367 RepID=A0A917WJP9_9ACTN|nr:folate-binding protein [Nakamurella endophytica]GGM09147.1 glycine cleavage system protein T [Nakamurella endophytica]
MTGSDVPPTSPLLGLPGAVAADRPDAGVAWHYGDPMREQRAAEERAALVDLSHRGLVRITGPDRLRWLHTLASQELGELPDGGTTQALLLSPQGHVLHHLGVTDLDGTTWLDTEAATVPALLDHLQRMVFWSDVQVHPAGAEWAQLRVVGPEAASVAVAAGLVEQAPATGTAVALAGGGTARGPVGREAGAVDLLVPRAELGAVATRLLSAGARAAGSWAWSAVRAAARIPRWGVDTDDRTIPNELSWLDDAVHLHKGCYPGQETVARVLNVGRPPRRLVLLHLDGSVDRLPETGSTVLSAEGRPVGRVGTVAQHHELGPVALALVKRGVAAGAPLLADGVDAAVDPDDDAAEVATPLSAVDRRQWADLRRR